MFRTGDAYESGKHDLDLGCLECRFVGTARVADAAREYGRDRWKVTALPDGGILAERGARRVRVRESGNSELTVNVN